MKRVLMVGYDLNKPGQNYQKVHEAIKGLGSDWWHYLDSTWLVVTTLTASQGWDRIAPAFDKSDSCLVLDVTGDDYSGWLPKDAWAWIRQHLSQRAYR